MGWKSSQTMLLQLNGTLQRFLIEWPSYTCHHWNIDAKGRVSYGIRSWMEQPNFVETSLIMIFFHSKCQQWVMHTNVEYFLLHGISFLQTWGIKHRTKWLVWGGPMGWISYVIVDQIEGGTRYWRCIIDNPIKLYVNANKFDCLVTVTTEIS